MGCFTQAFIPSRLFLEGQPWGSAPFLERLSGLRLQVGGSSCPMNWAEGLVEGMFQRDKCQHITACAQRLPCAILRCRKKKSSPYLNCFTAGGDDEGLPCSTSILSVPLCSPSPTGKAGRHLPWLPLSTPALLAAALAGSFCLCCLLPPLHLIPTHKWLLCPALAPGAFAGGMEEDAGKCPVSHCSGCAHTLDPGWTCWSEEVPRRCVATYSLQHCSTGDRKCYKAQFHWPKGKSETDQETQALKVCLCLSQL